MEGQEFSDAHATPITLKNRLQLRRPSRKEAVIAVLTVVIIVVFWFFLLRHPHKNSGIKPIAVVSALSSTRDVPIYLAALGSVNPTYSVTVRTQINGILTQVPFKEGQMVKAGDLLAQVDPRPYEALLTQYEGNLKRDTALLANAKIDLKRYQTLWKQDSVSQQTLATQTSLVEQYEGAVKIDQGLIQSTQVSLSYCKITAPIGGRIGLRLVDPGNFVQIADTNGIAVINTINPINVIFTLAEDTVPEIIPQIYADKTIKVRAYDRQQNQLLAIGTLLTIDNQIDSTTGTVKLKATFDNKDNKLFPNQFVNMKMLIQTLRKAIVVPTAAIQHTINGDFVYVLNEDQTVTFQSVVTGPVSNNDTVIKKGIEPGIRIIVDGADKLTNGAKVLEQKQTKSSPPIKTALNGRYLRSML